MILSVIIPVYNCEEYIENCILSLQHQNLRPEVYEIIIIDDGSTDNTKQIITNLSKHYNNVIIKSQENLGLGSSRNRGLSISNGKYIYYLDADDFILENTLSKIILEAEKNDLDILGFKSKAIKENHISNHSLKLSGETIKISPILDGIDFIARYNYKPEVWWYIIKREFLIKSNIKFYPRKFAQDTFYTPLLFLKASRIAFLPLSIHRYRLTKNSVTRTQTASHIKQHLNDMIFAITKLVITTRNIPKTSKNLLCIEQLKKKINYYTFLIFVRITKSNLTKLEIDLHIAEFIKLGIYPIMPLDKKGFNHLIYNTVLRTIFNSKALFYFSRSLFRFSKEKLIN